MGVNYILATARSLYKEYSWFCPVELELCVFLAYDLIHVIILANRTHEFYGIGTTKRDSLCVQRFSKFYLHLPRNILAKCPCDVSSRARQNLSNEPGGHLTRTSKSFVALSLSIPARSILAR